MSATGHLWYSFAESDAELRAYWHSRTPQERMEALEELRIRIYGQEAIDARIPPVFGVAEPRRSCIDGEPVKLISLADLKINKRASGRNEDLADLDNLPD